MRAVNFVAILLLTACATTRDAASLRSDSNDAWALAVSLVTEVGPRLAGTEGDARAVQWAVRKFDELEFENVRAETVTVPR
ncbi:MAG: peptidase M28 family protein, partial [Nevskiaceae bacterium]